MQLIASKIDEELKHIEADMAMGKAEDFGAYKYACGIYRGLLLAKDKLLEVHEMIEKDD